MSALAALYEISTTEGWTSVMFAAVDSRAIDMQPVENNNQGWIIFFVFFMIIGSFLMTNLFVGVIIENFNDLKDQKVPDTDPCHPQTHTHAPLLVQEAELAALAGDPLMSDNQRAWVMTQKLLLQMISMQANRPPRPANFIRGICFDLCQHVRFEQTIMLCIGMKYSCGPPSSC